MKKTSLSLLTLAVANALAEDVVTLDPISVGVSRMDSATGLQLTTQQIPQSVSIVSDEQLKAQRLNSVGKVLNQTTGVYVSKFDRNRDTFYARGYPIDEYQVDGLKIAESDSGYTSTKHNARNSFYERVEVVRGSTGLLNGSGDPSASINLVRKKPKDTQTGSVEASAGSYATVGLNADVSLPVNERVRTRFVVDGNHGNSFVAREKNRNASLYGVIEADLTDTTKATAGLSYEHTNRDDVMWGGLPSFYTDGRQADFPRNSTTAADWSYWNTNTKNAFLELDQQLTDRWTANLKYNYRQARGAYKLNWLYSNFAYTAIDRDTGLGLNAPSLSRAHYQSQQHSLQAQVNGKYDLLGREHEATAGVSFSRFKHDAANHPAVGNSSDALGSFYRWDGKYPQPRWDTGTRVVDNSERETGLFAATRLNLTDEFSLLGGARLSSWRADTSSWGSSSNNKVSSVWTPYLGMTYAFTPEHSLYASYTDIFKPQSQRNVDGKRLDPVKGRTYEVGYKGAFLDDKVQTQLALFQSRQNNVATRDGTNVVRGTESNATPETAYVGRDGNKVEGFDVEVFGQLTPEFSLNGGYTYSRSKDRDGKAINTDMPKQQLKAFAYYDAHRWAPGWSFGAGTNYQSKIYRDINTGDNQTWRQSQKGFFTANAMARYQFSPQLSAQLNVDNLFDKKYKILQGYGQTGYGEGRSVMASVRYDF